MARRSIHACRRRPCGHRLAGLAVRWLLAVAVLVAATAPRSASAQAPVAPETARAAGDFLDSVGVNTHLHYQGTPYDTAYSTLIKPKLLALGVRHVRDAAYTYAGAGPSTFYYQRCRDLAAAGIRFDLVTSIRTQSTEPTDYGKLPAIPSWCDDGVEAFEGANEPDIQPIPAGSPDWATQTVDNQRTLFSTVKGHAAIAGIAVIGPAITWSPEAVGDLSGSLDFGNWHPYPGGECPTCPDVYGQNVDTRLPRYRAPSGGKPMIMTETGYHNALNAQSTHRPVSELAAGKYMPRLLFEHFNRGFQRTYLYEFLDPHPDPGKTNPDDNFGLLRVDGSEKPAYRALRSVLGLLQDRGPSFTPGALAYGLTGATPAVHHTLLQKRDGTFYVALWQEVPSYDPGTRPNAPDDTAARGDRAVAPQPVHLTVPGYATATVHSLDDAGTMSSASMPLPGGGLDVAVTDRVTVVALAPSPSGAGTGTAPTAGQQGGAGAAFALSGVRMRHRVFSVVPRHPPKRRSRVPRGTAFIYTLSQPATVRFTVERMIRGRLAGRGSRRRCVAVRRGAPRRSCLRPRPVGVFRVRSAAGTHSTPFSGRIKGRALPPGRYRAVLLATDARGAHSARQTLSFRIVRAR